MKSKPLFCVRIQGRIIATELPTFFHFNCFRCLAARSREYPSFQLLVLTCSKIWRISFISTVGAILQQDLGNIEHRERAQQEKAIVTLKNLAKILIPAFTTAENLVAMVLAFLLSRKWESFPCLSKLTTYLRAKILVQQHP